MSMKKKKRDRQGKMIPWIKTKLAKTYKKRMAIASFQLSGMSAACAAQVYAIHSQRARTPEEKLNKAYAIGRLIVDNAITKAKVIGLAEKPWRAS